MTDNYNHGGGSNMMLKIVGTASDIDEINQIENICKIFVVEHWIRTFNLSRTYPEKIGESKKTLKKEESQITQIIQKKPIFTIRGLK